MRLFQFISLYRPYIDYFYHKYPEARSASFEKRRSLLVNQRYYASHVLKPVYDHHPDAFFTATNEPGLQQAWALEHGLRSTDPAEILRAQIEEHRTEVLYSLNPITYDSTFIKSLPGCVKRTACWNAAESGKADFSAYGVLLCNFPLFLEHWRKQGLRAEYFFPSHDPAADCIPGNQARPIDISFAGQYSLLHKERNRGLECLAALAGSHFLSFRLCAPKWKQLSSRRGLRRIKLPVPFLPESMRRVASPAVYGLEMYEVFSMSKIVYNATGDVAKLPLLGPYRGNMRCFEALSCGACMIADKAIYPDGFIDGEHFVSYTSPEDAVEKALEILASPDQGRAIASAGRSFVQQKFSKERQWELFQNLVS